MEKFFTADEVWYGGFYELAIELGETSDERLLMALLALWSFSDLEGCYLINNKEPDEQKQVQITNEILNEMHLYGSANLPDGQKIVCGSFIIREDEGSDWLGFYIPMGSLEKKYNLRGYPFASADYSPEQWKDEYQKFIESFDSWLTKIGLYIYSTVKFQLALIGHEISGETYASDVMESQIPNERWFGYLWAENNELNYFPRNVWQPEFIVEK